MAGSLECWQHLFKHLVQAFVRNKALAEPVAPCVATHGRKHRVLEDLVQLFLASRRSKKSTGGASGTQNPELARGVGQIDCSPAPNMLPANLLLVECFCQDTNDGDDDQREKDCLGPAKLTERPDPDQTP
jgi:hypothetical protein